MFLVSWWFNIGFGADPGVRQLAAEAPRTSCTPLLSSDLWILTSDFGRFVSGEAVSLLDMKTRGSILSKDGVSRNAGNPIVLQRKYPSLFRIRPAGFQPSYLMPNRQF